MHLVNRCTGEKHARSYKSTAFFVFHHANAYEQDGCIVIDFCSYENGDVVNRLSLENVRNDMIVNESEEKRPYLTRLVFPLHVPDDAEPGENFLANYTFAGKCTAVLETDSTICLREERLADIGKASEMKTRPV